MNYYQKRDDYVNYANAASAYLEKYNKKEVNQLYDISEIFYKYVKDKTMLGKAEGWAKQMCEIAPNEPVKMDMYARLLYVNEKKQDALKLEKQALEIVNSEPGM